MSMAPRTLLGRLTERVSGSTPGQPDDGTDATPAPAADDGRLPDREVAVVSGTVHSVTLRPRTTVPALVVELHHGAADVNLVWLGRRRIGGIRPGVHLTVTGRVTHRNGKPTIFNPSYEIVPTRAT